jgi:hypothetical protein
MFLSGIPLDLSYLSLLPRLPGLLFVAVHQSDATGDTNQERGYE